jgi:hypothetical protein
LALGVIYFVVTMNSGINIGIRYIAPSIALFLIIAAVGISLLARSWPPRLASRCDIGTSLVVVGESC